MKITTTSPWLRTGVSSNPYVSDHGPASGMMRYNTNTQNIEVFDGVTWVGFQQNQEISTTSETDLLLQWVRDKMAEETKILEISEKHPAVKIAYEQFKKSADQLKTTIILSTDEQTTN